MKLREIKEDEFFHVQVKLIALRKKLQETYPEKDREIRYLVSKIDELILELKDKVHDWELDF